MKFFEVTYIAGGKKEKIVFESSNRIDAIHHFKAKGLGIFVGIKETAEPFSYKINRLKNRLLSSLSTSRVPLEPYIATLRQLTVMLDAGMPINECLNEILITIENKKLHIIFTSILADIEGGQSFTNSASPFKSQLGEISISMFNLGEQTGELPEAIGHLSEILQEIHDNRQKLKKATRYPMTIIIAMAIAFGVVILNVVPQFQKIFEQNNVDLPMPTRILIWIKDFLDQYSFLLIGSIFVLLFIHKILYNNNKIYRYSIDKYVLKIYLIGDVIYLSMIGRFIYIFDSLSNAGIPIINSLNTAVGIIENAYIKEQLESIISSIEDGKSVTQSFRDSEQFESMILQMIDAGERSGAMNPMLNKISIYYRDKYQYIIDNVSVLMEPILLAGIAVFILILALGIFLPMWSMAEVVKG